MNSPTRPWPPLIVAEHVPPLVRWRDFLLTLILWGIFWLLLEKQFELFLSDFLRLLGIPRVKTTPDWRLFFQLLLPYWLIAAALGGELAMFSLDTLRRRRRALLDQQPQPLGAADQARRTGLDESTLVAAREQRIVIVHMDADGRHRIEVPHTPQSAALGGDS